MDNSIYLLKNKLLKKFLSTISCSDSTKVYSSRRATFDIDLAMVEFGLDIDYNSSKKRNNNRL